MLFFQFNNFNDLNFFIKILLVYLMLQYSIMCIVHGSSCSSVKIQKRLQVMIFM